MPNPAKPLEVKLRNGNAGHARLPDPSTLHVLAAADEIPVPTRALGKIGGDMWRRMWSSGAIWLARDIDAEAVLVLCEQMDERQILRVAVNQYGDWRERAALRALEKQIMAGLGALAFNPVERGKLGVAEVKMESTLDRIRRERADTG